MAVVFPGAEYQGGYGFLLEGPDRKKRRCAPCGGAAHRLFLCDCAAWEPQAQGRLHRQTGRVGKPRPVEPVNEAADPFQRSAARFLNFNRSKTQNVTGLKMTKRAYPAIPPATFVIKSVISDDL